MRREIVKEEKIHKISPLLVFNIYFGDTRGFPDSISEHHQPLHHVVAELTMTATGQQTWY